MTLLTNEELEAIYAVADTNDGRKPDVAALRRHIESQAEEIERMKKEREANNG